MTTDRERSEVIAEAQLLLVRMAYAGNWPWPILRRALREAELRAYTIQHPPGSILGAVRD